MAETNEYQAVTKAFSGLGIDEKALVSILGKWQPQHKHSYRKETPHMFLPDERKFERFDEDQVARFTHELLRFKNAVVLWTMHPWERDARFLKEALTGRMSSNVVIEIACTRSSEELLGARKAYHSLFDHSIEEDVASVVRGHERKLLVSLVSAYRYDGTRVKEDVAKSEAKELHHAIKNSGERLPVEDDEVVRILSTRSKLYLKAVYKHYNEMFGTYLDQDLNGNLNLSLKEVVQCLCTPEIYFSEALDAALTQGADEFTQQALTRVIVCQADVSMKEIKATYHQQFGVHLSQKIEETVQGNFKDLLQTLVSRED